MQGVDLGALALDVVLVLALLAALHAGWNRGVVASVLGAIGFLGGGLVGLAVFPGLLQRWLPDHWAPVQPLLLLVLVLVAAGVVQGLIDRAALPLIRGVRSSRGRGVDSALGAVVQGAVAAVSIWVIAGLLGFVPSIPLRSALASSSVLTGIDRTMPVTRGDVLQQALITLDSYRFPRVFPDEQAPDVSAVDTPDASVTAAAGVEAAARSVYRIDALAMRCGRSQEGTGWALGPDTIITNAHVVAGADQITVLVDGRLRTASLVAFDPRRDLAMLRVDGLGAQPLQLQPDAGIGTSVVMAGYPLGGPYTTETGRIALEMPARGSDIYGEGPVTRNIFVVRGEVQPGNSGGPALTTEGAVAGVVFARAMDDDQTAYVLTLDELDDFLAASPAPPAGGATACAA